MGEQRPTTWGVIGIPNGIQMVYSRFAECLAQLVAVSQANAIARTGGSGVIDVAGSRTCYVGKARNELVRQTRERGAKWLFQTDTDHAFPPDLLVRLLDTAYDTPDGAGLMPVVSGLYLARDSHLPQVYAWRDDADWDASGIMLQAADPPRDEPFRAGVVGAGALLVQMTVFDHIEKTLEREPFAEIDIDLADGDTLRIRDDVAFCYNCKLAGVPIVVEPRAFSRHIQAVELDWEHLDRAQQDRGA